MLSSFCSKSLHWAPSFPGGIQTSEKQAKPLVLWSLLTNSGLFSTPQLLVSYFALEAPHDRRTLFSHSSPSSWLGTPSPCLLVRPTPYLFFLILTHNLYIFSIDFRRERRERKNATLIGCLPTWELKPQPRCALSRSGTCNLWSVLVHRMRLNQPSHLAEQASSFSLSTAQSRLH